MLNGPARFLPGNHDLDFDAPSSEHAFDTFRDEFGPEYYSYDSGKAHVVALSTVAVGAVSIQRMSSLSEQAQKVYDEGAVPLDALRQLSGEAEQQDADGTTYAPQPEVALLLRIADVDDILRAVRTRAVVDLD